MLKNSVKPIPTLVSPSILASNSSFNKGGSGDIEACRIRVAPRMSTKNTSQLHPSCADLKGAPNAMGFAKHSSALVGNSSHNKHNKKNLPGVYALVLDWMWWLKCHLWQVNAGEKRTYCGVSWGVKCWIVCAISRYTSAVSIGASSFYICHLFVQGILRVQRYMYSYGLIDPYGYPNVAILCGYHVISGSCSAGVTWNSCKNLVNSPSPV